MSGNFRQWTHASTNKGIECCDENFHPVQRWKINEKTQIESQMKLISFFRLRENRLCCYWKKDFFLLLFLVFLWRNAKDESLPLILFIFHSTVTWGNNSSEGAQKNFSKKQKEKVKSDAQHCSFTNNISLEKVKFVFIFKGNLYE